MKKKTVALLLVLVLVLGVVVGGTIAYLTANTKTVTNTFTSGKITMEIAEEGADENLNKEYKIVPGVEDDKEPVVTVKSGSEVCYVYALVDNQLNGVVAGAATLDINTTNWVQVATSGTKTLYRYSETVNASSADVSKSVFTTVTYLSTLTSEQVASLEGKTITVQGYAHQSEGVDTDTADAAAKAFFGIN